MGFNDRIQEFVDSAAKFFVDDSELHRMAKALLSVSKIDDTSPTDIIKYASSLLEIGSIEKAEEVLAEGEARFPTEIAFLIEAAWISHRRRDWLEARFRWEKVKVMFPGHHIGYLGLSMTLVELGERKEAELLLEVAAAIFPECSEVSERLASIRIATGEEN
jgi:predicted Zn-dependent protease